MSVLVFGQLVDDETRCVHYHLPVDVIAIKFACCEKFYPCYQCHNEYETHEIKRWQRSEFDHQAILCGVCQSTLSIAEYMKTTYCPVCQAQFNAGCQKHYGIYFEV